MWSIPFKLIFFFLIYKDLEKTESSKTALKSIWQKDAELKSAEELNKKREEVQENKKKEEVQENKKKEGKDIRSLFSNARKIKKQKSGEGDEQVSKENKKVKSKESKKSKNVNSLKEHSDEQLCSDKEDDSYNKSIMRKNSKIGGGISITGLFGNVGKRRRDRNTKLAENVENDVLDKSIEIVNKEDETKKEKKLRKKIKRIRNKRSLSLSGDELKIPKNQVTDHSKIGGGYSRRSSRLRNSECLSENKIENITEVTSENIEEVECIAPSEKKQTVVKEKKSGKDLRLIFSRADKSLDIINAFQNDDIHRDKVKIQVEAESDSCEDVKHKKKRRKKLVYEETTENEQKEDIILHNDSSFTKSKRKSKDLSVEENIKGSNIVNEEVNTKENEKLSRESNDIRSAKECKDIRSARESKDIRSMFASVGIDTNTVKIGEPNKHMNGSLNDVGLDVKSQNDVGLDVTLGQSERKSMTDDMLSSKITDSLVIIEDKTKVPMTCLTVELDIADNSNQESKLIPGTGGELTGRTKVETAVNNPEGTVCDDQVCPITSGTIERIVDDTHDDLCKEKIRKGQQSRDIRSFFGKTKNKKMDTLQMERNEDAEMNSSLDASVVLVEPGVHSTKESVISNTIIEPSTVSDIEVDKNSVVDASLDASVVLVDPGVHNTKESVISNTIIEASTVSDIEVGENSVVDVNKPATAHNNISFVDNAVVSHDNIKSLAIMDDQVFNGIIENKEVCHDEVLSKTNVGDVETIDECGISKEKVSDTNQQKMVSMRTNENVKSTEVSNDAMTDDIENVKSNEVSTDAMLDDIENVKSNDVSTDAMIDDIENVKSGEVSIDAMIDDIENVKSNEVSTDAMIDDIENVKSNKVSNDAVMDDIENVKSNEVAIDAMIDDIENMISEEKPAVIDSATLLSANIKEEIVDILYLKEETQENQQLQTPFKCKETKMNLSLGINDDQMNISPCTNETKIDVDKVTSPCRVVLTDVSPVVNRTGTNNRNDTNKMLQDHQCAVFNVYV